MFIDRTLDQLNDDTKQDKETFGRFFDTLRKNQLWPAFTCKIAENQTIPFIIVFSTIARKYKKGNKIGKRVVWNGGRQAALFTAFTILVNDVCEPIEKILIPTSLHIWPGDCQLVSYPVYHLPFCEHTRELG